MKITYSSKALLRAIQAEKQLLKMKVVRPKSIPIYRAPLNIDESTKNTIDFDITL